MAVSHAWNRMDYIGIVVLITGTMVPCVRYGFFCSPNLQHFYLACIATAGAATIMVVISPHARTPAYRRFRTWVFIALGLSAVFPIGHVVARYGMKAAADAVAIRWAVLGGALYIFGALMYAERFPERLSPGSYDYVGASHQLFHVSILYAATAHYCCIAESFRFWHGEMGGQPYCHPCRRLTILRSTMAPSLLSAATAVALADLEREKRWRNTKDTFHEYCYSHGIQVLIGTIPVCDVTHHRGVGFIQRIKIDLNDIHNFDPTSFILLSSADDSGKLVPDNVCLDLVTRTTAIDPVSSSGCGLRNLLFPCGDVHEDEGEASYAHVEIAFCPPVRQLYIESPRGIEISLVDIQRVVRSPTGAELSEEDAQELCKMFLHFEIAVSEEQDYNGSTSSLS
ncbi:hypothetical protein RQP46_003768 [Phenoliferia psychrophenolica]